MNSIREWLNSSRDYNLGVALYKSYGTSEAVKEMLSQGHSEYRAARLLTEMLKLKDIAPVTKLPTEEPKQITVAVREEVLPENRPEIAEDPYKDQWREPYTRMNYLRHHLAKAETDEERGEMAHEILDLEVQCMSIWAKRDYFLKYGEHMPDAPADQVTTNRNEIHRRLMNIRTYITKAQKKLAKNPEDKQTAGRLQRHQAEAKRLEHLLNQLN